MSILKLIHINKKFDHKVILQDASYCFETGKIYGFIGPNGSGKTTTIKMILGLLRLDSGQILVNDLPVTYGETPTNKFIGYLSDVPEYYHYMNAREYLTLCAKITSIKRDEVNQRVTDLLNEVGLDDSNIRITKYSRGMKQRLGIAQALIHNPEILICDEPTSALDPKGRQEILDILERIKHRTTVVFSTHILTDIERICDEVIVLAHNKITNINTFKPDFETPLIRLKLKINQTEKEKLSPYFDYTIDGQYTFISSNDSFMQTIYEKLNMLQIYPEYIERIDNNIETLYLEVTS